MTEQLKTCPFCGCEMRIKSNRDTHQLWGDHDADCVFVAEEATGQEFFGTDAALGWMIAAWNRRASQQVPEGFVIVPDAHNMTDDQAEAIAKVANCCGGIAYEIYCAAIAAAPAGGETEKST